MLDNLRGNPADDMFEEEDTDFLFPEEDISESPISEKESSSRLDSNGERRILGMTAPQRLIIAIMLMFAVFSLGAMCLLLTGKFALY